MTVTIDFLSLGIGFALGLAAWGLFFTIVMAAGDIR
jgi:hypothetical protein